MTEAIRKQKDVPTTNWGSNIGPWQIDGKYQVPEAGLCQINAEKLEE